MNTKKRSLKTLVIALILVFVSMIGSSLVQTSFGKVTIKDLQWETPSGHMLSALLLIPDKATEENPAPAIITSHGWYNNREMQDLNYVEYARRGYVVMSIDMYGHGNSDIVETTEWPKRGTGMYDAVELVADLPYVDAGRIGVTGHSNGARAANWSVLEDSKNDEQLISAVLLVANDAMYSSDEKEPIYWSMRTGEEEYTNRYGSRDVGIIAAQYDEFFFRSKSPDGSHTVPRDYINTEYAQSFLNFGVDPKTTGESRTNNTIYKQEINGKTASRVIYTPDQIHPWNNFSKVCVEQGVEFFNDALGAPNPLAPSNQIWQFKAFFNFLGLVGFVLFVICFTISMLYTNVFASLKAKDQVTIGPAPDSKGKIRLWASLLLSVIISGVSYLKIYRWCEKNRPSFFVQRPVFFIACWTIFAGIVTIILLVLSYHFVNKKNDANFLQNSGVAISGKKLGKTILLAFIVVTVSYGLVFVADYFFKTDFRLWVIALKAFTPNKVAIALIYLPFFLVYYIANSIAINSFNYVRIGKKEWFNTAIMALMNGLAPIVLVIIQYAVFFDTGEALFPEVIAIIWLFPIVVILPVAAIISRKIYKSTKNPYLAGLINAIIVTLVSCANTLTQIDVIP